jgi:hypothetical protein
MTKWRGSRLFAVMLMGSGVLLTGCGGPGADRQAPAEPPAEHTSAAASDDQPRPLEEGRVRVRNGSVVLEAEHAWSELKQGGKKSWRPGNDQNAHAGFTVGIAAGASPDCRDDTLTGKHIEIEGSRGNQKVVFQSVPAPDKKYWTMIVGPGTGGHAKGQGLTFIDIDRVAVLRVGERTCTIEETATGVIATVCPGAPQTCH